MSDLFKCVVCGHSYPECDCISYLRSDFTCLCSNCLDSDAVKLAHDNYMSIFDYVLIPGVMMDFSDQDPDQED